VALFHVVVVLVRESNDDYVVSHKCIAGLLEAIQ